MKGRYSKISIEKLCRLFGKSRLAWYDRHRRKEAQLADHIIVLDMVILIRQEINNAGTPMLYRIIKPKLDHMGIKMGRAALHQLLLDHGMTIRTRKRRYPKTTNSKHWMKKWPNLIRGIEVERPMHIWVADITYIRLEGDDFCFLSLLQDAYSHLVVGWCLCPSLSHEGPLEALKMALEDHSQEGMQLIHHSDRGSQYCCTAYVGLLTSYSIQISMTENKDPYENPVAERINRTMKHYLGLGATFPSIDLARKVTTEKIRIYNEKKPHSSCDYLTPIEAHKRTGPLKKWWKKRGS